MKVVIFGNEAREKLKKGVDLIANAVKTTLGPRGRNVIYGYHYGYPLVTKDGVTVARQIESKDQTEQLGVLLIKQVAQKTADDVGDGTTTATILAAEIFNEGLKALHSGANPILIKRGIDRAVQDIVGFIDSKKIKDETVVNKIAMLSANNDKFLGDLIATIIDESGPDGIITIDDNFQNSETFYETVEGMQLNEGIVSPYFITNPEKMEAVYQNAHLLIIDSEIHSISQISGILDKAIKTGYPIILFAHNFHSSVLQILINSRIKNQIPIAAVKTPYFGEYRSEQLIDLAIITNGKVFGPGSGLRTEEAELSDLGRCETFKATKYWSNIVKGAGNQADISGRISVIKKTIEDTQSDYEKEKLRERLSKLTTGVFIIKVGGASEAEQKEKKMRVEDALLAAKAALDDGIVPGGGIMLLKAIPFIKEEGIEEELIGQRIIKRALRSPIMQISRNSGIEGAEIIAEIMKEPDYLWYGYDFLNNQFGNLYELGIIDPAKVVKSTIINAASIAGLLLTTECVCNEEEEAEISRTPKPRL